MSDFYVAEERIIPGITPYNILQEHVNRYMFALDYVKDKIVLDLACGSGYGSFMLAENCKLAIGIDIDKRMIDFARKCYIAENLEYFQGNAVKLPYSDNCFDVIISFETIEHLRDSNLFLNECKRLLKPDGLFICSTPNSLVSSPDGIIKNPFHMCEYTPFNFSLLLNTYFVINDFYGQRDVNIVKNRLLEMYLKIKGALGIKRDIFIKSGSGNNLDFPVNEFKDSWVKSAYMVAVCKCEK